MSQFKNIGITLILLAFTITGCSSITQKQDMQPNKHHIEQIVESHTEQSELNEIQTEQPKEQQPQTEPSPKEQPQIEQVQVQPQSEQTLANEKQPPVIEPKNNEIPTQAPATPVKNEGISVVAPNIDGEKANVVHNVSNNVIVRTGVNMDTLYIAATTGGNYKEPRGYLLNEDSYGINMAVKSYFGKYTSTKNAKEIYNKAMQTNNPPHKFINPILADVLKSDDEVLLHPQDASSWEVLSNFSNETNATEFFRKNRSRYKQMIEDFTKKDLNFNHVQRLQEFIGKDLSKDRFEIVLSTIMNGGQAINLRNSDGSTTFFNIMNPTDPSGFLNTLYHETAHNFYEVRKENSELIKQYAQYADALGNHEADFGTELNETIARVTTVIMIDKYHGKKAAIENLNLVAKGGWKNVKEISTLVLNKYINDRDQYKNFKDFMPVIFEYLKALSQNKPYDIGPQQF